MKPSLLAPAWLMAALSLVVALILATRVSKVGGQLVASRMAAETLAAGLAEIQSLRSRNATATLGTPPEGAVTTALLMTLDKVGLPEESLRQQSAGGEMAIAPGTPGQPAATRRDAMAVIGPISLRQLGDFFAAWKNDQPSWVLTQLDLSHVGSPKDATYTATLKLTTVYVTTSPR